MDITVADKEIGTSFLTDLLFQFIIIFKRSEYVIRKPNRTPYFWPECHYCSVHNECIQAVCSIERAFCVYWFRVPC